MDAGLGSNTGLVWTQTWEGSLLARIWWSALCHGARPGHSLNKHDGAAAVWTWAWPWACQLPTLETGPRDVEHHLSGQEGTGAGARGGEVPARYSQAHVYIKHWFWNRIPGKGLDSGQVWGYSQATASCSGET